MNKAAIGVGASKANPLEAKRQAERETFKAQPATVAAPTMTAQGGEIAHSNFSAKPVLGLKRKAATKKIDFFSSSDEDDN